MGLNGLAGMIELIALPPGMSLWAAGGLIGLSFFASLIAAAIGLGGGILMLAAMANLLPAAAIVPVHAVVQLGSNAGRAWLMRISVDRTYILPFVIGSIVGVALGSTIYVALPTELIRLILGLFILQMVWWPLPFLEKLGRAGTIICGLIAAFLTMFIGATGPFVATIWKVNKLTKKVTVATHACAMVFQHGIKIIAFGILGFAFGPWILWIILVVATGFAGTVVGGRILDKTPDARFHLVFKWVLTILAVSILWQAIAVLLNSNA